MVEVGMSSTSAARFGRNHVRRSSSVSGFALPIDPSGGKTLRSKQSAHASPIHILLSRYEGFRHGDITFS